MVKDDGVPHDDARSDEVDELRLRDTADEAVAEPLPGEPVTGLDFQATALPLPTILGLGLGLGFLRRVIAWPVVAVPGQGFEQVVQIDVEQTVTGEPARHHGQSSRGSTPYPRLLSGRRQRPHGPQASACRKADPLLATLAGSVLSQR